MPVARPADNRVAVIEGRRVLIVQTTPPLPASLETLLEGGRDAAGRFWPAFRVIARQPLSLRGATVDCLSETHRLAPWLEGMHTGSDGLTRHLRLLACADCGAVCVRDISLDTLPGLRSGRSAPRRRDHILGWYTGARPSQRTYS